MHARIVAAYTEQATIEHGESPVRRRFVTVTGEESQIFMEDVSLQEHQGGNHGDSASSAGPFVGGAPRSVVPDTNRQLFMTIISQIQGLKRTCTEQIMLWS